MSATKKQPHKISMMGRPRVGQAISITLTEAQLKWIDSQLLPGASRAAFIRSLVHAGMSQNIKVQMPRGIHRFTAMFFDEESEAPYTGTVIFLSAGIVKVCWELERNQYGAQYETIEGRWDAPAGLWRFNGETTADNDFCQILYHGKTEIEVKFDDEDLDRLDEALTDCKTRTHWED